MVRWRAEAELGAMVLYASGAYNDNLLLFDSSCIIASDPRAWLCKLELNPKLSRPQMQIKLLCKAFASTLYLLGRSTTCIFGIACCRSFLSFSVGTRPSFSSTLSESNMPAPAYTITPSPMKTRVLGAMLLYHCQTAIANECVCVESNGG